MTLRNHANHINSRVNSPSLLSQLQASAPRPQETPRGISSPLLEALATAPPPTYPPNTTHSTTEWAKNIPLGRSPPEAPCTFEAQIEGSPPLPQHAQDEVRGGFNQASPPVSPSAIYRQPVRRNNGYQGFGDYLSSSPGQGRPVSTISQVSPAPPLPHQAQAHFYSAPEIDFGLHQQRTDTNASQDKYWCGFDCLGAPGDDGLNSTENVLLVGFDGGLSVYRIGKKSFEFIGRLAGLRGSVINAKILPSTSRADRLSSLRPLVAVILHGPQDVHDPIKPSRPGTSHSENADFDLTSSMLQALHNLDTGAPASNIYYQTTVEVFSLKKSCRVATLLRCPKVEINKFREGTGFVESTPSGNLTIQAQGKFIVVSSGVSGEIYIFENQISKSDDYHNPFKYLGKVWTRVLPRKLRSLSMSSNSSESDSPYGPNATRFVEADAATYSLSYRWLAIVPPPSSAQTTMHGVVDSVQEKPPPGSSSHTSPPEPQITCEIENPEEESVLSKVARDVTQEVIKGARWVGDRGVQVWNNYWAKPPEQPGLSSQPFANGVRWDPSSQQAFPPTHANDEPAQRPSRQPALVSILDLEKLSGVQTLKASVALQPVATFSLPYGCSMVSFSPSGLNLFTASAKGDVQHVWDLLRMVHGGTSTNAPRLHNASERRPVVREIARFTRMTVANIIEVVWTKPRGERFAIVTERGTVHIFDLPASAFRWPPPRRRRSSTSLPNNANLSDHDVNTATTPTSTASTLSVAMDLVAGKTQPLMAAVRGRPNISNAISGLSGMAFSAGAGAKGGKSVAASFAKSVDAATGTVKTLRHLGENRLALPGSPQKASRGCVMWLNGKDRGLIAVTGRGIVRIHSIRQSTHQKVAKRRPSVLGGKVVEFGIPHGPSRTDKGSARRGSVADDTGKLSRSPQCLWLPRDPDDKMTMAKDTTHPLSCAEIETNAPYQPFHTDSRITFYVFAKETSDSGSGTGLQDPAPWAFGEPIPATKVGVGSSSPATLDDSSAQDPSLQQTMMTRMENFINVEGTEEGGQQVIFTTRRKRRTAKSGRGEEDPAGAEDEFFEDDCEVVDFAEDRV